MDLDSQLQMIKPETVKVITFNKPIWNKHGGYYILRGNGYPYLNSGQRLIPIITSNLSCSNLSSYKNNKISKSMSLISKKCWDSY